MASTSASSSSSSSHSQSISHLSSQQQAMLNSTSKQAEHHLEEGRTSQAILVAGPPQADPESKQPIKYNLSAYATPEVISYFVAGGVAGAASRTVVSPLERLKIIQQIQPPSTDGQYRGVWRSLVRMWNEEGVKGLLRGNGINCLRIVPYSAVQFTTYEQLKKWFTRGGKRQLDTPTRLASGALAGITSVCTTYPLDLVRSRLSIATATIALPISQAQSTSSRSTIPQASLAAYHTSAPHPSASSSAGPTLAALEASSREHLTMVGMAKKVMREEGGFRALYRGLPATAFGVAPYVGINFASYEALRGFFTPPGQTSVFRKLLCGALAGSISQTITYPMDVLRRKMQVTGMSALGARYDGAFDAMKSILRTEGVKGLYKGLWPNLLKVAPSIATSFFTYELVKEYLIPPA